MIDWSSLWQMLFNSDKCKILDLSSTASHRTLGFLRQNLGKCPETVKSQAYTTLVRPRLEYCSSEWDPHTQKHIKDIKGIQHRAATFVKGCSAKVPGTGTNLFNELEWPSLQQRRQIARLTKMYKNCQWSKLP